LFLTIAGFPAWLGVSDECVWLLPGNGKPLNYHWGRHHVLPDNHNKGTTSLLDFVIRT
jgi:hypothetical protein